MVLKTNQTDKQIQDAVTALGRISKLEEGLALNDLKVGELRKRMERPDTTLDVIRSKVENHMSSQLDHLATRLSNELKQKMTES